VHGDPILAEGGEADVTLAADFSGDRAHADIVKCREGSCWECAPINAVNFRVDCF
jgi:hypothetical protein